MLARKLRIRPGTQILIINAPASYRTTLGELPEGVKVLSKRSASHNYIHLFVTDQEELNSLFPGAVKSMAEEALLWISFPKGGSGIQTDLTRDKGWSILEKYKLRWLAMISFDQTWSAFLLTNAKAPLAKGNSRMKDAAVYFDSATKTVKIPDDLNLAFKKDPAVKEFFASLSFTNRKEYVLWIVTASKPETRVSRLQKTLEKLRSGKKNPSEK
jgi:hypothetical protein